ncbi:MAG: uroporphyrinogen-III C-methyltransferase [Alteromonadaceae bacterium]|nr:uroporphyrinogen-III C-methyltransferase [Alteromonadaceae bacterium]
MTDKKQLEDTEHSSSTTDDSSAKEATEQAQPSISSKARKSTPTRKLNKNPNMNSPDKISKTAVFALLLAITAIAGIAGMYYWHDLQQNLLEQRLTQQNQKALLNNQAQVKQLLTQQQQNLVKQLSSKVTQIQLASEDKIKHLENTVARLSQNNPSDWLTHEAEYLIRIAARTMWLERDTKAAIGLLFDADARLKELNDPKFLPARQLIHQDITALKLIPELKTEDIILELMALNKQVESLILAMVYIPESNQAVENFELTENTADWRDNLQKTWGKFLGEFITVSRRTASVEPLMSPQHQQNLRENLSLKIQLAQWAASQEMSSLYQQTLVETELWLNDYFDMQNPINQVFQQSLQALANQNISFVYPENLSSLQAMRAIISNSSTKSTPVNKTIIESQQTEQTNSTPKNTDTQEKDINKTTNEITPETNTDVKTNTESKKIKKNKNETEVGLEAGVKVEVEDII